MIPDSDSRIGISVYCTDFEGTGGRIRAEPEDFQVTELISERAAKSIRDGDGYAVYRLRKRRIDTGHALSGIFRKTGIRLRSLGLKDALAVTEQFVCSENRGRVVDGLSSDRYSLEHLGFVKKPLSKRDMIGNHFRLKISRHRGSLESFADYDRVLNFYGYQRFGSQRPVTHLVGKAILQRDFERCVDLILSFTSPHDSKENTEIREKLADRANHKRYYDRVPPQMDTERTVLRGMINHGDPIRAIRAIPIQLRRFYVQAYQSFIFNRSLSCAFLKGKDLLKAQSGDVCFDHQGIIGKYANGLDQSLALPFVGYSYYKKTRFDFEISEILKQEGISPKDFFIKEMQEVSSEGGFRQAVMNCSEYSAHDDVVEFSLSRGSFATILLREIMRPRDPILAGF